MSTVVIYWIALEIIAEETSLYMLCTDAFMLLFHQKVFSISTDAKFTGTGGQHHSQRALSFLFMVNQNIFFSGFRYKFLSY